jgi:CheY-like chemotaxis protein
MVRATPGMRDVPFIVITACGDPEVQAQYQRAKATSFVTKERMAREMNSWITSIVDARPAPSAAA